MRKILFFLLLLSPAAGAGGIDVPDALSGRFTQVKEIREAGVTLRSEGSFAFSKSRGIRWETEKPFKSAVTLCPGAPMEGGEIAKQVAAIMQSLLVQNDEALSRYFDVTRDGSEMRLKTTDETIARVFSEIVITGEKYVKTVTLANRQGDLTTINFTDVVETAGDFSCE